MNSPAFSLGSLERELRDRRLLAPFLVFGGREEFLKERTFDRMVASLVPVDDREENVRRRSCGHLDVDELLGQMFCLPFNTSPRLFLFSAFDELGVKERGRLLKALATDNGHGLVIVFTTTEARVATEIINALAERCRRLDFWAPFENQFGAWLQKEAATLGARLDPAAGELLRNKVGSDVRALVGELEKLTLTVGPGGQITPDHVRTGVGYVRQDTIFNLLEEIGARRAGPAARLVESLLLRGESAHNIWYMIAKTLREYGLLHAIVMDRPDLGVPLLAILKKILSLRGKTDFRANQDRKTALEEMADTLKRWPDTLVRALGLEKPHQGRNLALALMFSPAELHRLDDRLIELDRSFKGSPPNLALLLQRFLLEILPKRPEGNPRGTGKPKPPHKGQHDPATGPREGCETP